MSRSEFCWSKKRKHYSYLFKDKGNFRLNIIISTKSTRILHSKVKYNIRLIRHPNKVSKKEAFVIPFVYMDAASTFGEKSYMWSFDKNDKRKIKRIKRKKIKKANVELPPKQIGYRLTFSPDKSGKDIKTYLLLLSNNNSCLFYEIAYNNDAYQELRNRECKNAIATLVVVSALLQQGSHNLER